MKSKIVSVWEGECAWSIEEGKNRKCTVKRKIKQIAWGSRGAGRRAVFLYLVRFTHHLVPYDNSRLLLGKLSPLPPEYESVPSTSLLPSHGILSQSLALDSVPKCMFPMMMVLRKVTTRTLNPMLFPGGHHQIRANPTRLGQHCSFLFPAR